MDALKRLVGAGNYDKFDKKINDRQFLMGRFYDATVKALVSPACKGDHHSHKKIPKTKIRKLLDAQIKIKQELSKPAQKGQNEGQDSKQVGQANKMEPYELYLPLNNLWKQYSLSLISKQTSQQTKQLKVLRSDFHGALLTVVSSKNDSLVGLEGIVIKQTLRTFEIITKIQPLDHGRNNVKIVLKSICIFMLEVGEYRFMLNGSSLVYRPSDRIKHKFKFKKAEKINHQFLALLSEISQEECKEHK